MNRVSIISNSKNKMKTIVSIIIAIISLQAYSQEETIFLSGEAHVVSGYLPWKSFQSFRKEYNTVNSESMTNSMGSLSPQYGYALGFDCFVSKHLYSSIEYMNTSSRTQAKFNNGSKRLIRANSKIINTNIGWLQATTSGYWTLTTGFSAAFGNLRSFIEFADGTRYQHTAGLSGEFHDLNIGVSLNFEWNKQLSERLYWRSGAGMNFFLETTDLGMQNTFVTQTAGSLSLNNQQVNYDISGLSVYTGLAYKLFIQE